MTVSTAVASRAERVRANVLGVQENPGRPRRRRGRLVAGVVLVAICGWLGAVLFLSAGSREEVLVLAGPVERYGTVERGDLRVSRVATDGDVSAVSADRLDEVVGRAAAVDLVAGSMLSEDQLLGADENVIGEDEAVVGLVLAPADSPAGLSAGAEVEVVVRGLDSELGVQTLSGWVLDVVELDSPGAVDGERVSVVLPTSEGPMVSAAGADGRVSVVMRGSGS